MPRKTPVKELLSEEVAVASSPLRRSSRLSNNASPVPTSVPTSKVLSRRNSSTSETSSTSTPTRVAKSRRSSLSQEIESTEEVDKKNPKAPRTRRASNDEKTEEIPVKRTTRGSSAPREQTVEVKRPVATRRRRSVSEDGEKVETPVKQTTRFRSSSITKKTDIEDLKAKTPSENVGSSEENTNSKLIEEAKSVVVKVKKLEIAKVDLDLSVINETSLTEDEAAAQEENTNSLPAQEEPYEKRKTTEPIEDTVSKKLQEEEKSDTNTLLRETDVTKPKENASENSVSKSIHEKLAEAEKPFLKENLSVEDKEDEVSNASLSETSFKLNLSSSINESSLRSETNENSSPTSNKENVSPQKKTSVEDTECEPMDVDESFSAIPSPDKRKSLSKTLKVNDVGKELEIAAKATDEIANFLTEEIKLDKNKTEKVSIGKTHDIVESIVKVTAEKKKINRLSLKKSKECVSPKINGKGIDQNQGQVAEGKSQAVPTENKGSFAEPEKEDESFEDDCHLPSMEISEEDIREESPEENESPAASEKISNHVKSSPSRDLQQKPQKTSQDNSVASSLVDERNLGKESEVENVEKSEGAPEAAEKERNLSKESEVKNVEGSEEVPEAAEEERNLSKESEVKNVEESEEVPEAAEEERNLFKESEVKNVEESEEAPEAAEEERNLSKESEVKNVEESEDVPKAAEKEIEDKEIEREEQSSPRKSTMGTEILEETLDKDAQETQSLNSSTENIEDKHKETTVEDKEDDSLEKKMSHKEEADKIEEPKEVEEKMEQEEEVPQKRQSSPKKSIVAGVPEGRLEDTSVENIEEQEETLEDEEDASPGEEVTRKEETTAEDKEVEELTESASRKSEDINLAQQNVSASVSSLDEDKDASFSTSENEESTELPKTQQKMMSIDADKDQVESDGSSEIVILSDLEEINEEKEVCEDNETDEIEEKPQAQEDQNISVRSNQRRSSFSMQENLKAGEENTLREQIHKVVDLFCAGIKNKDVQLNVSLEYTGQFSDNEGEETSNKDIIEVSLAAASDQKSPRNAKGSKRRKIDPESRKEELQNADQAEEEEDVSPSKNKKRKHKSVSIDLQSDVTVSSEDTFAESLNKNQRKLPSTPYKTPKNSETTSTSEAEDGVEVAEQVVPQKRKERLAKSRSFEEKVSPCKFDFENLPSYLQTSDDDLDTTFDPSEDVDSDSSIDDPDFTVQLEEELEKLNTPGEDTEAKCPSQRLSFSSGEVGKSKQKTKKTRKLLHLSDYDISKVMNQEDVSDSSNETKQKKKNKSKTQGHDSKKSKKRTHGINEQPETSPKRMKGVEKSGKDKKKSGKVSPSTDVQELDSDILFTKQIDDDVQVDTSFFKPTVKPSSKNTKKRKIKPSTKMESSEWEVEIMS